MAGHLSETVHGFYSYCHPVTVTPFAVMQLASDASSYRICKSNTPRPQSRYLKLQGPGVKPDLNCDAL